MVEYLRRLALVALLAAGLSGCGDGDKAAIIGPGLESGPGRTYAIRHEAFATTDGVEVSALVGRGGAASPQPAVILLHDLNGTKETWLTDTPLFLDLLEKGYTVVALDLRGCGETPLPEGRQVLLVSDLEVSYRDVQAAVTWLDDQAGVDASRIGVVGIGLGANVAYVSAGALADRIKAAVSVSAGLWEKSALQPVVVGTGVVPFAPRSLLYIAGAEDVLSASGTVLSYADLARALAATTAEPKSLFIVEGSGEHGLDLLNNVPEVLSWVLSWLDEQL